MASIETGLLNVTSLFHNERETRFILNLSTYQPDYFAPEQVGRMGLWAWIVDS